MFSLLSQAHLFLVLNFVSRVILRVSFLISCESKMALMTLNVQTSFKDSMNKVLLSSANLRWWPQIQYVNRTFLKEISIVLKEAIKKLGSLSC